MTRPPPRSKRTDPPFPYTTLCRSFTSDVNMRFKFDTGPLSHQLLVGVDYSNYFERTRSASDTSSRPGSVVTTIDIYDPVSTGFAVLPYDLLPEQRNTQL